ncbi:MAG: LptF/LptG family permease [Chitinophagaceae bacterium]|nr:LptF/LptG family permease [Chitinophagaceae bacterium]
MIKKLDTLIIRAFIGPFFATFVISMFVLVMQFFWLYIDDLVGKGIDTFTILTLIMYVAATAVPLALPLALLISSIMTFGNLGESFELVAIKSAGIPLLRFMRPLIIVTVFITGIAFLFANNIIPFAQLKLATLKYDIIVAKPAFDIKEGTFYNQIKDFTIKIGKKEKDDSTIRNVVIFEKRYGLQDNMLVAESGIMRVTGDKKFLEFTLRNGWRYEEKGPRQSLNTDYIRLGFKEYKKVLDLKDFNIDQTPETTFKYDPKMLSVRQLNTAIDSLRKMDAIYIKRSNLEISPILPFTKYIDTGFLKTEVKKIIAPKSFAEAIPDSLRTLVYDRAINQINGAKNNITAMADDYAGKLKSLRYHEIEWHRKFALSFACMVLFLIGAPLGSIIRKGGLGLPLVFSIIFFVIFHLFNTFGEKFVKENVTSALFGMWLSTLVLMPIAAFLIYKAMRDSQLFNQEFYYRSFTSIRKFIGNFNKSTQAS